MAESQAYKDLISSLNSSSTLLSLDRDNYSDPPSTSEQAAVEGLRGGCAVMMVAALELFLKEAFAEHLSIVADEAKLRSVKTLPKQMQTHNIFKMLEIAMSPPRHAEPNDKFDRIAAINAACKKVMAGELSIESFTDTFSNPNSMAVKTMFKNISVTNIFAQIQSSFERKSNWGKPVARTFIADKLDEIVKRRHKVAHTAQALSISRQELEDSIRFLKLVCKQFDTALRTEARKLKTLLK